MTDKAPEYSDEFCKRVAEQWLKTADVYERHQRLGHFKSIDGDEIARQLRTCARQLLEKSIPLDPYK